MATLYIIRGLPGSGKSTLAKKLVHESRHREADMFHLVNGEYCFKIENIKTAHAWCLSEITGLLLKENADCAVSNTFTQRWEYQPYIDAAKSAGYSVSVIECHGPWENCHNVPVKTLARMAERWQPHNGGRWTITGNFIL